MSARPSYYLHSYGCQMNKLDSELVESRLVQAGYARAASEGDADVVLLNTCSVRQHAEDRVWSRLGVLRIRKRKQPSLVVGVLGCMAEEHKQYMQARMPHVDLVVGPSAFGDIDVKVEAARQRNAALQPLVDAHGRARLLPAAGLLAVGQGVSGDSVRRDVKVRPQRAQAYVSIMRGCNMPCTYCIVPATRGAEVSRPMAAIVDEVQRLCDDGVTEVCLLGQTVNAYGRDLDEGGTLPRLLAKLHDIAPLRRLAFITSHPNFVTKELVDALAGLGKLARYLHFPAQSGSDTVLKAMRRGYTRERYLARVEQLARVPDLDLHSDFIVGYPGESAADFEQTVSLMAEVRFAQSYVFKYSPRPGTVAAQLADDVPESEKQRRNQVLLALQAEHTLAKNRALVGTVQEVLVEHARDGAGGRASGRTVHHRIVHFDAGERDLVGRYVPVRITHGNEHSLLGEVLADDAHQGQERAPASAAR
jgi:tRNA-2-methylthio-N6-dimethylallyladenosine synthase